MSLISTPGASNANTYADAAYAASYFQSRLGSDAWANATADNKEAALAQSATIMDSIFEWQGERTTEEQSMRWPRAWAVDSDGYDIDNDVIPSNILKAQCELAIYLITNEGYTAESRSIDRLNLGSIKLDFDNSVSALPIPNVVIELLRGLGTYRGTGKAGSLSVPLLRV